MYPGDMAPSLRTTSTFWSGLNFIPSHCVHEAVHFFVHGTALASFLVSYTVT